MWRHSAPRRLPPQTKGLPQRDPQRVRFTAEFLLQPVPQALHLSFGALPWPARLPGTGGHAGARQTCQAECDGRPSGSNAGGAGTHGFPLAQLVETDISSNATVACRLRFSSIGPLLAAPPKPGELQSALASLGARAWRHPSSGLDITFGVSTLERWYYAARRANDPVAALRNRLRGDINRFPSLNQTV